jgi:hypothetical protein
MLEVQIVNDRKYEKALVLLYSLGGMFRTRPFHKLVIGPVQHQALIDAGLVEANGEEPRGRGKKKKA